MPRPAPSRVAAALKHFGDRADLLQNQQSADQNERQRIEAEIREHPWYSEFYKEFNQYPNLGPNADYDYITAWKAGIRPERDPYDQNRYHWSSKTEDGVMLKKPEHPTLWKTHFMDKTGQNPDAIGVKTEQQAQEWLRTQERK